jgi:hypothetical protein
MIIGGGQPLRAMRYRVVAFKSDGMLDTFRPRSGHVTADDTAGGV